ncbi:23S rRNA (adenine1618-N6)-methyltransferase [Daejeonella lutea]|uniref:Ribosomal RNA large subunit methyltransferase F n=2 Tax=Daejeonella lutea TaxID=572036 RepID=A0A1T5AS69_9SPHI|nr:23S rRNA (adenine1618-N6)-methyltransferase [Daejeonella lutea]
MIKPDRLDLNEKQQLHSRNKHRGRYDFQTLVRSCPELEEFVILNPHGSPSIDFKNSDAVKTLNKALLSNFYGIGLWDIPEGYLCPPIPGRADYIHYLADLLDDGEGEPRRGKPVRVLDVGTGANCIYPLIGHKEYGWTFVGSEIDHLALRSAKNIVEANHLTKAISIRKQSSVENILEGIIHHGEKFDAVMCNPPFHASLQESMTGTERKWKNLGKRPEHNDLNFGGKDSELWCEGGELRFVTQMIKESASFVDSVKWFTSLISKKETLSLCISELKKLNLSDVKFIPMSQGQKVSRILAWKFR